MNVLKAEGDDVTRTMSKGGGVLVNVLKVLGSSVNITN